MKIYTCWITCLLETYQDKIVSGLIKKGYTVGLCNVAATYNHDNQPSALLALNICKLTESELTSNIIYEEVYKIFAEINGQYYSIIVAETSNSIWTGSNIFLSNKKPIELPPSPDASKKSKLN